MKELVKGKSVLNELRTSDVWAAVFSQIISGVVGVVCAAATVFGKLTPFGTAFLAAAPFSYIPSAAIGAFFGYFAASFTGGGFRYIAALLAVLAIRLLLSGFKRISSSPLFVCGIPFLSLAVTAPVSKNGTAAQLAAEAALAAFAAYFFNVSFKAAAHRRAGFSPDELAAFMITLSVWLSGISKIQISGVALYRIISVLLILSSARYGGTSVSCGMGVACAFSVLLSGGGAEICAAFAFLGLITGVFKIYGKIVMALGFMASALVCAVLSGENTVLPFAAESLAGCLLFLTLPRSFGTECGKLLTATPKITVQSDVKKLLKVRLTEAATALGDVKDTVEQVSAKLTAINSPDFGKMLRDTEEAACSGCKLRLHCWESKKQNTADGVNAVIDAVKKHESDLSAFLSEEFRARCLRPSAFCEKTAAVYDRYAKSLSKENRIAEVRQVMSEQFDSISLLLKETAADLQNGEYFDKTAAETAAAALKNLDIFATEAVCRVNRFGRMTVKIKANVNADTALNKLKIMKALSLALEKDFCAPVITKADPFVFISAAEAPRYKPEVGTCKITAAGSSMCGDCHKYFYDGTGRFFVILSDGMGTGGAAAVDSAMAAGLAARLIKSGFGFDCTLKLINSSMLFKSTEESTATLDVASVDLYTGKTEIYKAGAAPTVVRHSGRTGEASGNSLPIGILKDVSFDRAEIRLKEKDIILMMSDGATSEGTDWIRRELLNCGDVPAQNLAESIAAAARRRRSDRHEDDITVIAVVLSKA